MLKILFIRIKIKLILIKKLNNNENADSIIIKSLIIISPRI